MLCDMGSSNPGLCDTLEVWDGVGGGREERSRRRGHVHTYGWFMMMYGRKPIGYCKAIILQSKVNK